MSQKSKPFSIRLTPEERAKLEQQAGNRSLGEYIRECLLGKQPAKSRAVRSQFPTKDKQALATVLALLGKSAFSTSLSKLAHAVQIGALSVSEETEALIHNACIEISEIKTHIMKALGIQEK
ncbi:MAG: hypothetical protein COC24_005240 [Alphaproteobacteria bacterium]|nr:hypothetical protein [Alphaproteobacteria bacterium]